ncbi:DegV family protein [[Mycoplasma] anseris]|uniref:DegV family EDD domain-containing protein n=1 Tax=[Mycoplasma] anseris TaxID=92400 RepID=A0A2Z4NDQ1_9BACT|nr:DegV family protein [[Mycoplasma] anseris]AWX69724.1 DegV family EDD domain-containing protein [[Mycoplasma] anseris]
MKIKILVDSSCGLDENTIQNLDWELLPLQAEVDNKIYEIGKEMNLKNFALMYRQNPKINCLTTATPIGKAQMQIDNLINQGYDKIVVYTISKHLSSQNSMIKTLYKDNDKVFVIDSNKISFLMVKDLLLFEEKINNGESFEKAIKIFDDQFNKILLIPEFNDALVKGGRLSKPAAVIAKLLKIVPIIEFKNGELVKYGIGKVFRKTVIKMIKELWDEFSYKNQLDDYEFVICNADNTEIDYYVEQVKEITKFNKVSVFDLPTVIAVHTGIGALTLSIVKVKKTIKEKFHSQAEIK